MKDDDKKKDESGAAGAPKGDVEAQDAGQPENPPTDPGVIPNPRPGVIPNPGDEQGGSEG